MNPKTMRMRAGDLMVTTMTQAESAVIDFGDILEATKVWPMTLAIPLGKPAMGWIFMWSLMKPMARRRVPSMEVVVAASGSPWTTQNAGETTSIIALAVPAGRSPTS